MSQKYKPGRIFGVPLLNGGYAFGVITFYSKNLGMFCNIFDHFAQTPTPPDNLESYPFVLKDLYFLAEFTTKPQHNAGEKWFFTKQYFSKNIAPTTRWVRMSGDTSKYKRSDLFREFPSVEVDDTEVQSLLDPSTPFPPGRTAEIEIAIKRLSIESSELIETWRAEKSQLKTKDFMHDGNINLIEMPEHDSISVCVYNESDDLFQLGEKINERFKQAEMNGYNWDALISFYIRKVDPDLMQEIETDPEAGMFSAYMPYSAENLNKMKRFESYIRELVTDEAALMKFIEENIEVIEWD